MKIDITHYDGCWLEHPACAQDRIRLLENKLQVYQECLDELGCRSLGELLALGQSEERRATA